MTTGTRCDSGSDGTEAGTAAFFDMPANLPFSSHAVAVQGTVIFVLSNPFKHVVQVWRTDGTTAGTRLVEDFSDEA